MAETDATPDIDVHDFQFITHIFPKKYRISPDHLHWNDQTQELSDSDPQTTERVKEIISERSRETLNFKDEAQLQTAIDTYETIKIKNGFEDVMLIIPKRESSEILILSLDYEKTSLLKHSIEVKIGTIKKTKRQARIIDPESRSATNDGLGKTKIQLNHFITYERIYVYVGTANILELDGDVDCIVDPINDTMEPFGGHVSRLLTKAGGDKYVSACKKLHLKGKGKCKITTGGNLKTPNVMHTVCSVSQSTTNKEDVFSTVVNCLDIAEKEKFKSIIFPFVFSGNGNVHIDVCCKQFVAAVVEYSRQRENIYVCREIYFVDICDKKVWWLRDLLSHTLPQNLSQIAYNTVEAPPADEHVSDGAVGGRRSDLIDTTNNADSFGKEGMSVPSMQIDETTTCNTDEKTIQVNGCVVHIYEGKIRDVKVDVIVCPEDLSCSRGGHMAASLKIAFRRSFKEKKLNKLKKQNHTAMTIVTPDDKSNVKFLLHIATPFYPNDKHDLKQFEQELQDRIKRAFEKVQNDNQRQRQIRSMAFPLMGIDDTDRNDDAIRASCRAMAVCVNYFCANQKQVSTRRTVVQVTDIHLVFMCPQITRIMIETWKQNIQE